MYICIYIYVYACIYIYILINASSSIHVFNCFLNTIKMFRGTRVHYQVESYQRLEKWYMTPPCLILSIIRYGSRNSGNGVAPPYTSV